MALISILDVAYSLLDNVRLDSFACVTLDQNSRKGQIPDFIVRLAIRVLLKQRLRQIDYGSFELNHAAKMKWIEEVRNRATIADLPEKANEQLYEASVIPTRLRVAEHLCDQFTRYLPSLY